jgi:retron-type reverse transcriptase
VDWINLTGAKKVHSLIDKVYKRKNLEMAWERVKANRGSGGVDGETLDTFEAQLGQQLDRLQRELKEDTYQPQPVRQHPIPKRDKPGEYRLLGIPTIYDRVCQQALLNRLEPIFEPVFDDASFGYRRGRSTKDALRKIWKEIQGGSEWIVDADLRDFFGSVDHYAYPKEKSIRRFMDQVRQRTKRKVPLPTKELIEELNPLLRGWGEYYKRAHVRRLFHRLDGWILRRIWSHRYKRWRNGGWKQLPKKTLTASTGLST